MRRRDPLTANGSRRSGGTSFARVFQSGLIASTRRMVVALAWESPAALRLETEAQ